MKVFLPLCFIILGLSNNIFAQLPSYVPTNGLVGWWPFTGNANDLSVNGNNGTVNGATITADRFGMANSAYSFDGVNDYIQTNYSGVTGSNSRSISFWARTNGLNGSNNQNMNAFCYGNNSTGAVFEVALNHACEGLTLDIDNGVNTKSETTCNNNWNNFVIVFDNSSGNNFNAVAYYCNGILLTTTCSQGNLTSINTSSINPVVFGSYWNHLIRFFQGQLDDIGIWNRALTQQEITNLYNANNAPQASITAANNSVCAGQSTTITATVANAGTSCNTAGLPPSLNNGLVGYWPFCGNAIDASGNGNNGSVNGATLTADRFGVVNSAYGFNGASRIDIGSLNNQIGIPNSSWSVNCWFKSAGSQIGDMVMVSDYSSASGGDQVISTWLVLWSYSYNNKVGSHIRYFPNGWDALSNNSYNDNQWHSLVSVAETGNLRIYIDGNLITAVPYPSNTNYQGSPFFRFGTILFNGQFDSYFQGQLDDIGIWNRALSAQEVSQLYNAGQATYLWSNGATTPSITVTPTQTTTYTCTISMNGATTTQNQTITVNALPTVSASANQTICAGTSVTLSGSGATSYVWNNGVTNATAFTPVATQNYTVTGTDANGCVNTAQVQVSVNALPIVIAGANQTVCAGTSVTLSGTGATSYVWNNGVANATAFTPVATQTYTVTGTNANGCVNTAQVQVTVNALPIVSAGANQTVCAGTSVTLSGSGATSYVWNNGITNANAFTPVATQTYTVTGTDANGCTNTAQVALTVNALPTVSAGANQTLCAGSPLTLSGSGATTYAWNNGVTNGVAFTPANTQTYTVTGTDANGCVNTAQVQVSVNALPTVSAGANQTVCSGTSVTLSGSGATSYVWNNGVTNATAFTPVATQTYAVTGIDSNLCSNSDTMYLTVNESSSSFLNQTACDFYTLNGQNYTQSGTYLQTLTNTLGCDSTINLNLTMNYSPTTPMVSVTNDVNLSTTVQLNASYQWIICSDNTNVPGATTSTYTATSNGLYGVIVSNTCGADTSNCINIDNIGLNENLKESIIIYPNPSFSYIKIMGLNTVGSDFEVRDGQGRILKIGNVSSTNSIIDLGSFEAGIYWVNIKGIGVYELVKE